jgi:hypothetical protein
MTAHRRFSRITGEVSQPNRFVSQSQIFRMLNNADPPCASAEAAAAFGRPWLSVPHEQSAVFCDDLVNDSRTYPDVSQESIGGKSGTAENEHRRVSAVSAPCQGVSRPWVP